jgi:hypothetical protein
VFDGQIIISDNIVSEGTSEYINGLNNDLSYQLILAFIYNHGIQLVIPGMVNQLEESMINSISNNNIFISADTIDNLDNFFKTTNNKDIYINKFIYDIGAQILLLKDYLLGIKYFNLKDIIVLNKKIFLFNNPDNIYKLSSKEYKYGFIDLQTINKQSQFIPPEFSNNKLKEFYYTTSFYSFVKLLLFCFDIKIDNIQNTSLYYFCKRCLEKNPEDRIFLYI